MKKRVKNPSKKLNVLETSVREVEQKWGFSLPRTVHNPLFIRCNAKGEVNWEKAPIYQQSELTSRGNYEVHTK